MASGMLLYILCVCTHCKNAPGYKFSLVELFLFSGLNDSRENENTTQLTNPSQEQMFSIENFLYNNSVIVAEMFRHLQSSSFRGLSVSMFSHSCCMCSTFYQLSCEEYHWLVSFPVSPPANAHSQSLLPLMQSWRDERMGMRIPPTALYLCRIYHIDTPTIVWHMRDLLTTSANVFSCNACPALSIGSLEFVFKS